MNMQAILSWGRQTTTVQGIALLAATVAMQVTSHVEWPVIVAGATASLVLLILPGQGDLSRKIGVVVADAVQIAVLRGSAGSIGKLAQDGAALVQGMTPTPPATMAEVTPLPPPAA